MSYVYGATKLGLGGTAVGAFFLEPARSLRLQVEAAAASATDIVGVVFEAPDGSDITGNKVGEFTGEAFEATLESSQAVIYVPTKVFGGEYLDTNQTPVALVKNGTYTTGIIQGTIVED